jgi:ferric-dicitrate binding protein FerR (iron transport regulator)
MSDVYQSDEFIARWVDNQLGETDRLTFERWLAGHPQEREKFDAIKTIWWDSGNLSIRPADVDVAWENVRRKIQLSFSLVNRRHAAWPWLGAAATILVIFSVIQYLNRPMMVSVATARGETITVTLPDRSEVTLNAESSIAYDKNGFDDLRSVALTGEALFNVVHSSTSFVVYSRGVETRVVGTSFNIRARDDLVEVACLTGKVAVRMTSTHAPEVELTPGFATRVVAKDSLASPYDVDVRRRVGWIHGRLFFDQTPLDRVFEEVSRQLNVRIEHQATKLTFTGMVEMQTPEKAVEIICLTAGLRYRRDSDSIFVILK